MTRRVWRYLRGNHNLYIEDEQITQWPKENEPQQKPGVNSGATEG